MALTVNFSVTEGLANPNELTFTDLSSGSDGTITNRRIYVRTSSGTWLTESGESTTEAYTDWSYANSSTTLSLLSQSTAAEVTVAWYAESTLTYSLTEEYCFNVYDYLAALQILQGNTSSPDQVQDTAYFNNLIQFVVNIFNEENAIEYGADIYSSQGAMNRNNLMIENESYYF